MKDSQTVFISSDVFIEETYLSEVRGVEILHLTEWWPRGGLWSESQDGARSVQYTECNTKIVTQYS